MKEVRALVNLRQQKWDPSYFEKQGYFMRIDDFLDIKRRSKLTIIAVAYSRTNVRKKMFGDRFWDQRTADVRSSEHGQERQDKSRRHSVAIVRAVARAGLARAHDVPAVLGTHNRRVLSLRNVQRYFEDVKKSVGLTTDMKLPYQVKHLSLDDFRVQRYSNASHDYRTSTTSASAATGRGSTAGGGTARGSTAAGRDGVVSAAALRPDVVTELQKSTRRLSAPTRLAGGGQGDASASTGGVCAAGPRASTATRATGPRQSTASQAPRVSSASTGRQVRNSVAAAPLPGTANVAACVL
jgi:hypothetical protein